MILRRYFIIFEDTWFCKDTVYDFAKIFNFTKIFNFVKTFHFAKIFYFAKIFDFVKIFDFEKIFDFAKIFDFENIFDFAKIFDFPKKDFATTYCTVLFDYMPRKNSWTEQWYKVKKGLTLIITAKGQKWPLLFEPRFAI